MAKIVPKANGTVHLTDRIVFNLSSVSVAEPHRTLVSAVAAKRALWQRLKPGESSYGCSSMSLAMLLATATHARSLG